jgi:hypothetical protein
MKRLGLALFLAVGAFVLVLGSSGGNTPAASAEPVNACGVPGFDVPDSGDVFDFTAACQAHDDCYAAGGGILARARCDSNFLRDMNSWCTSHWAPTDSRLARCKSVAAVYYSAVRSFGWLFFYQS